MNMKQLEKDLEQFLDELTAEDVKEYLTQQHTNMDELTTFNEGLGAGLEIMSKATWRKTYDGREINDYPPKGRWIIGIYKQKRKGAAPWRAELVMCVPEPDGDSGSIFVRGEQEFGAPDYWIELPDPNDFA